MARQQEATQWANYASLIGTILSAVQPAIGAVATGASAAVQLAYRREFEQEADYMGARYSRAAGFDAQGILDFFKKLADEQRHSPTLVPPYLLSHPLTDERLNHLEAVLRTKQWSGRERRPRSLELAYVQALTEAQSSRPAEVVAAYRGMADADPGNAAARYLYGVVCLETGQYDCARRALEEAQAAGLGAADRDLGRLALRSREVDRAVPLLRSAVEQNPDDAGAHAELAKALELAGDREGAIGCYERAIEASPDLEDAHHALGLMLGRSGREAEGFYHLATALRLRGDYEQALNQYVRAERALPGSDARAAETRDYVRVLSAFLRVPNPVRGDAGGLAPDAR
jgi:predicted Zn-dependent protease